MMHRLVIVLGLLWSCGCGWAQGSIQQGDAGPADPRRDFSDPQLVRHLELTPLETARLQSIHQEAERAIREARLELDIYRARIKRVLFQRKVDLEVVERLLRESMDWELRARLAEVVREVRGRELLGDERWARLLRFTGK
jgi:hypothetical protein